MRNQQRPFLQQCPPGQGGFTLIELMISLLLGILVIGGVTSVFMSNKEAYITNNALSQVQDSSRISFEMMARDIRETGLTGCGNTFVSGNTRSIYIANILNNGPTAGGTTWWADMAANAVRGYDANTTDPAVTSGTGPRQRVAATSSIELVSGDGQGVSITSDVSSSATFTLVENSSNFKTGDIVVVCNPDHALVGQITSYTAGSPPTFVMAAGSGTPGNCTIGMGYPAVCTSAGNSYQYAIDAMVSKVYAADWYIGNNPVGTTSLYRMTLVNGSNNIPTPTAQEMVRNVQNLTITYHVAGTASYVSAASVGTNWAMVDSVMLNFQVQSAAQYTSTTTQPITKQLYMTVTLRNRV